MQLCLCWFGPGLQDPLLAVSLIHKVKAGGRLQHHKLLTRHIGAVSQAFGKKWLSNPLSFWMQITQIAAVYIMCKIAGCVPQRLAGLLQVGCTWIRFAWLCVTAVACKIIMS